MPMHELVVESTRGVTLFVRDYRPELDVTQKNQSVQTFVWVHGLGEHGGRYLHVADDLVSRGWRVVLIDLRGHGRSTGSRTHVLSFDEYADDVDRVWSRLKLGDGSAALAAHSMGGLVVIRAVETGRVHPSALVLCSPLLGVKVRVSPLKRFLGRALVGFIPKARFRNGLDPKNMTRDEEFARERREDPLIIRNVTASWFFAMERAIKQAHLDAAKVSVPLLIFQGLSDLTTDGEVLASWMAKTNSSSKEMISLPDHVHEILHESDWLESLDQMIEWLERTGASRV